ncbi:hypothetical protein [Novosphingobium terrae]|uniref:hypothetical protein n=1 Tax=Novosphingobium terrae TaxID=2726189 RepID=UPI001981D2D0|nr:hypothetical protein [Novosphingobium terrae]
MATRHQHRDDEKPQDKRPHNREVEDEMLCPPRGSNLPPRPATEPRAPHRKDRHQEEKP